MAKRRVWIWSIVAVAAVAVVTYRYQVYRKSAAIKNARVVFVTGGQGPYWQITVRGAETAARDEGINLQVEMPSNEESAKEQIKILANLVDDDVDGIAISPLDADSQTHLINRLAVDRPVITYDSDAPLSQRQSYVGTNNYEAGITCGELVQEVIPNGGEIALLFSNKTKSNIIERIEGFQITMEDAPPPSDDGSEPPTYEIVANCADDGDADQCKTLVRQALADHPNLSCVVGLNGYHGPILMELLAEQNGLGQIKMVVFDAEDATLDGIAAGHIYATLAQDPFKYGYESVRLLKQIIEGRDYEVPIMGGGTVGFHAEPIRQDNVEDFRAKLQNQLQKSAGS